MRRLDERLVAERNEQGDRVWVQMLNGRGNAASNPVGPVRVIDDL